MFIFSRLGVDGLMAPWGRSPAVRFQAEVLVGPAMLLAVLIGGWAGALRGGAEEVHQGCWIFLELARTAGARAVFKHQKVCGTWTSSVFMSLVSCLKIKI